MYTHTHIYIYIYVYTHIYTYIYIFPIYSLYIPYIFPIYSLYISYVFPIYSLYIRIYSLYIPCIFPIYSLYIPYIFLIYSLLDGELFGATDGVSQSSNSSTNSWSAVLMGQAGYLRLAPQRRFRWPYGQEFAAVSWL